MRILALLTQDVFRLTIGSALEDLGHDVRYVDRIEPALLDDAFSSFGPDLLFDAGWDVCHCQPNGLESLAQWLQSRQLYHTYFAEEDWLHFDRWSLPYVKQVKPDYVLTRSHRMVPLYEQMGIQSAFLDVGCNPRFHRPGSIDPRFTCDVSVIANVQFDWDIFRRQSIADLVRPLLDANLDVKLYGRDWERMPEYYGCSAGEGIRYGLLPFQLTPKAYRASKINIGIQSIPDQCSNRTYDILCSGGFLLTSDTPAVREWFTPGVHCDVSSNPGETLEKVNYYLKHDDIRESIAARGMEYVQSKFAYQTTLPKVWPDIAAHHARTVAERM